MYRVHFGCIHSFGPPFGHIPTIEVIDPKMVGGPWSVDIFVVVLKWYPKLGSSQRMEDEGWRSDYLYIYISYIYNN